MARTPGIYRNEHDRQRRLAYAKTYYWRGPEKHKEHQRQYALENCEKVRANKRKYGKENRAVLTARAKARCHLNPAPHNERSLNWSIGNPEKRREYLQKSKTLHREERNQRSRLYAKKNPEKKFAHTHLRLAVRCGRVKVPDCCAACGSVARPHGHHPDYSFPLHVIWLCVRCHLSLHRD